MGEDSIFNGNLPQFRDEVVQATMSESQTQGISSVQGVILKHANLVINKMKDLAGNHDQNGGEKKFKKLVDKMLFNYRNIGMFFC